MSFATWLNTAAEDVARKLSQRSAKHGRRVVVAEVVEDRLLMSVTLIANSSPVYGAAVTFTATVTDITTPVDGSVAFYVTTGVPTLLDTETAAGITTTSASITLDNGISAGDAIEAVYTPGPSDTGNSLATSNPVSVTQASISPAAISGLSEVYNQSGVYTNVPLSLASAVPGDTVDASGTVTYTSAGVGAGITVNAASIVLGNSSTDANYTLSSTIATGTGAITPLSISPAAITGLSEVYNHSGVYTSVPLSLSGTINGDTVDATGTVTYTSAGVGAGITVNAASVALGNTSTDANYTLASTIATGTGAITPLSISPAAITGLSEVYNQSGVYTNVPLNVTGAVGGDTVTASGTVTYTTTGVGAGITVNAAAVALGNTTTDANYTLSVSTASGTGAITKAPLTVTVTGGAGKVYDGTTTDSLATFSPTSGVFVGDIVTANGTATFASPNAGLPVVVNASIGSIALGGSQGGDYAVTTVVAGSANITKATPTITVRDVGGAFGGLTFPATALITGVSGNPGTTLDTPSVGLTSVTLTYYSGLTTSGAKLAGAPSAVGTYTVTATATFVGSTNYVAVTSFTTSPVTFSIVPPIPGHVSPIAPITSTRPALPTHATPTLPKG